MEWPITKMSQVGRESLWFLLSFLSVISRFRNSFKTQKLTLSLKGTSKFREMAGGNKRNSANDAIETKNSSFLLLLSSLLNSTKLSPGNLGEEDWELATELLCCFFWLVLERKGLSSLRSILPFWASRNGGKTNKITRGAMTMSRAVSIAEWLKWRFQSSFETSCLSNSPLAMFLHEKIWRKRRGVISKRRDSMDLHARFRMNLK